TAPAAPAAGAEEAAPAGVKPGIHPLAVLGPGAAKNPYAGDPSAVAAGRQLFVAMNCAGCHSSYAGGGMGPSLRDSLWIYGGEDAQIFSSIAEGRAYGMPAWGGRLPDGMIWLIVAYIKTLGTSAEPDKPPVPPERTAREAPATSGARSRAAAPPPTGGLPRSGSTAPRPRGAPRRLGRRARGSRPARPARARPRTAGSPPPCGRRARRIRSRRGPATGKCGGRSWARPGLAGR